MCKMPRASLNVSKGLRDPKKRRKGKGTVKLSGPREEEEYHNKKEWPQSNRWEIHINTLAGNNDLVKGRITEHSEGGRSC